MNAEECRENERLDGSELVFLEWEWRWVFIEEKWEIK